MLQEAVERGELDPWEIDVIAVVDGFLDRLQQRCRLPQDRPAGSGPARGGRYEQDLAEASEAFLAASVLVSIKAEVLEASTLPPAPIEPEDWEPDADELGGAGLLVLPARPERHLLRRPVAPPPLRRSVSLGELIQHLEDIADRLEAQERHLRQGQRARRYSQSAAIAQVRHLAHRESLPETTAALRAFVAERMELDCWLDFEELVTAWAREAPSHLDQDRVGVFWALLFLCSQGSVALEQPDGLHRPLRLCRLPAPGGSSAQPTPLHAPATLVAAA
ncbi:segregation and condensation protein A [Synechococcus sp. RSCCF101]|uniref:segregation/condensation protein A n=1 Tax=Synechococcus sp. RSCCF101 TaxID=2511069 RepID=UPI0012455F21|nr:segregation/condensation protein A [Synechococcus sp. RSCCF101]QEY33520.1 segregation and condensation protein A [Synechococcus sp. RSCCF101]